MAWKALACPKARIVWWVFNLPEVRPLLSKLSSNVTQGNRANTGVSAPVQLCTHTRTHTHTAHTHTHMHTHTHTHTHAHTHARTHAHTHIHTHAHTHTCTHTRTHTHEHTHTHTHTHTHEHTHTRHTVNVTFACPPSMQPPLGTRRTILLSGKEWLEYGWPEPYIHRIWPYIWWFLCQNYRIYTVYL